MVSGFKPYKNQSGFQIGDRVQVSHEGAKLEGLRNKTTWKGTVTSITRSLVTVRWDNGSTELATCIYLERWFEPPINAWVRKLAADTLAKEAKAKQKSKPIQKGKSGEMISGLVGRLPACGECHVVIQYVNKPDAIYSKCPKCGKEKKGFGTEGLKVPICPRCKFGMIFKIDEEKKRQYYFCCHCKFEKEKK